MRTAIAALATILCVAPAHGKEPKPAAPPLPTVITIHEEQVSAAPVSIDDGKLVLKTDPQRAIPLDELAKVDFGNAPALTARWIGQDNHDVAQAKSEAGANGIQDIHVQLSGLVRHRPIKQLILSQGLYLWKSDTGKSKNWKLVVEHAAGSGIADLYAEPLKADRNGELFKVTVIYEDGAKVSAEVKASTATDNELKVVADAGKAAVPVAVGTPAVVVHFVDGGELSGELDDLSKESLRLKAGSDSTLEIPLLVVRALSFASATDADAQSRFQERLKAPGTDDSALVRAQDQSVTEIAGQAQEIREGKLRFAYQGQTRSINVARLVGLVFAAHPPAASKDEAYQLFQLANGDRISGQWKSLANDALELQMPWGAKLSLPAKSVAAVEFRNGKLLYLSDIEPAAVEEVSYFERGIPYRRDRSLAGEPLKLQGKDYRKGLAVHSRTILSYAIDAKYATFNAVVGFDEAVPKRGRVACRVLGDGRELFAEPDLRADRDPKSLALDVAGVRQLILEVDFGEDENICDRVIWAGARLYRE